LRRYLQYLRDPFYWRRALLRLAESLTGRRHLETVLDQVIRDNWSLGEFAASSPAGLPAAGTRLLYLAPKFDYGNPARGYSYEENHFLPSLVALGFHVVRLDSLSLARMVGRRGASELLLEVAYRFRPEVAFSVLFRDDFEADAVEALKRAGCVSLNWFTDDHWRFDAFSARWAPRFSWAITTDHEALSKYQARGLTNVIRSQWGVNHRLYRPLARARRYDVTFIGQPHGDRRAVIRRLRRAGLRVETWGYGWPSGKTTTRQAVEIINASAVNLNLSNAVTGRSDQVKGRDFEVPACRGLLLTRRVPRLEEYFVLGAEVLAYETVEELEGQIRRALADPAGADRVREAGYRRTIRDHTYERRLTEIFRTIGVFG
jgi:spore maturation protein CgeB